MSATLGTADHHRTEAISKAPKARKSRLSRRLLPVFATLAFSLLVSCIFLQIETGLPPSSIFSHAFDRGIEAFFWMFLVVTVILETLRRILYCRSRMSLGFLVLFLVPACAIVVYFPFRDIPLARQRAQQELEKTNREG